jgi:hypothetical protein
MLGTKAMCAIDGFLLGSDNVYEGVLFDFAHCVKNVVTCAINIWQGKLNPALPREWTAGDKHTEVQCVVRNTRVKRLYMRELARHHRARLTEGQRKLVDARWASISCDVVNSKIQPFTTPGKFKMVDWFHFLNFVEYLFYDILPPDTYTAWCDLCRCISKAGQYTHARDTLHVDEQNLRDAVVACDRVFPGKFTSQPLHALTHIYEDIRLAGAVFVFHTLPFERYMQYLRANIHSKRLPSENFMNRHQMESRLSQLDPRHADMVRNDIDQCAYTPSDRLAAAIGVAAIEPPAHEFCAVARTHVDGVIDDAVYAEVARHMADRWGCGLLSGVREAWRNARRQRLRSGRNCHGVEVRDRFYKRVLRERLSLVKGSVVTVNYIRYGSSLRRPSSAHVWIRGVDIVTGANRTWDGMWHACISHYVRVRRIITSPVDPGCPCPHCSSAEGIVLAAFRVYHEDNVRVGPRGTHDVSIVRGDLYPRLYYIPVDLIGGRECLCDYLNGKWCVYLSHVEY